MDAFYYIAELNKQRKLNRTAEPWERRYFGLLRWNAFYKQQSISQTSGLTFKPLALSRYGCFSSSERVLHMAPSSTNTFFKPLMPRSAWKWKLNGWSSKRLTTSWHLSLVKSCQAFGAHFRPRLTVFLQQTSWLWPSFSASAWRLSGHWIKLVVHCPGSCHS